MMTRLAIAGYRSLRDIRVTLSPLNVVTGGQWQRQVQPLSRPEASGRHRPRPHIQSLVAEGGLQSTLWAGPEAFSHAMRAGTQPVHGTVRKNPVSLKLGFSGTDYEAVSGGGRFTCCGAGCGARRRPRLPGDRAGEGTRRNRRQGRHAAGLDLAFAIIAPAALNAPSSRPSPRAAPWRSRPRTSSRRPRGASEWHPPGPSRPRD